MFCRPLRGLDRSVVHQQPASDEIAIEGSMNRDDRPFRAFALRRVY